MHKLLNLQLKKVYGKDFYLTAQDEKFIQLLELVRDAYKDYEEEAKFLENTLNTSAKELEESNNNLYQQRELLQSVENSMDDAIFYKDLEHKYIGGNAKFLEFLDLSERELMGKSDSDFFNAATAKRYYQTNEDIIKDKIKVVYKEWVNFRGKRFYILVSKAPLKNRQGEVIGIVGVSRDITHEYKLQKNLEHKNIMLIQQNKLASMGEMIANIAHQWRQPLNALSLLIQKLGIFYKQDLLNDEKVDTYISEAILLTQGMSDTIDDFRNFFKPDRVFEDFSVEESIYKSLGIIQQLLDKNSIDFNLNVEDKYFISGYKNEFFQVILNVLNNAVEALITDKINNPTINITITHEEKNIIIDICDNANGIKNSVINKIFDPYFTTKDTGTGLGLYMSKIIVEEHMRGKLSVQSSYMGTSFAIILNGGKATNLIYS